MHVCACIGGCQRYCVHLTRTISTFLFSIYSVYEVKWTATLRKVWVMKSYFSGKLSYLNAHMYVCLCFQYIHINTVHNVNRELHMKRWFLAGRIMNKLAKKPSLAYDVCGIHIYMMFIYRNIYIYIYKHHLCYCCGCVCVFVQISVVHMFL